ncbi:GGDEF domain-containing protein [Pseudochrobactrum asaccharolyticum]|uniref:GGDEF domain-containing protein n=1 Tax=Pseudochrobactrum asaccharolyticum TaxID=354351 RepID=UPI004040FC6B
MVQILLKATLVTALVVALSQIFSFSIRLASGQPFTAFVFLMNSIMPVLTGFPISVYIFIQNAKLKKTTDDLTEANRLLQIRADTDSMTGLLNRNAFLNTIRQLNKTSRQSVLLVIDADNFKNINDVYGHQTGDKALTAIVDALRMPLRQHDIIGRIGGEEFAVFLPDTEIKPALKIAEQLRYAVESIEFHPAEEQDYPLSISIGLAVSAPAYTTSQLMRMADQSLYQAKANGRNQIVVNQEGLVSKTNSCNNTDAA